MKSCKCCENHQKNGFCRIHHIFITDKLQAQYCKKYKYINIKKITEELVTCTECSRLNKYGYCTEKKRYIKDYEWNKKQNCICFKKWYPSTVNKTNKNKSTKPKSQKK